MKKALKVLQLIKEDCKEWNDKGFATEYEVNELNEAICELEDYAFNYREASCANCCKKLLCKQADKIKSETGCKLNEMWFSCWSQD